MRIAKQTSEHKVLYEHLIRWTKDQIETKKIDSELSDIRTRLAFILNRNFA